VSFGEELRRERELRSIELREVADATKVNIRYLEAMERNDFRPLPGGLFNRGFVRAYAEFIGIDPEGMVNAYLLEEQAQLGQHGSGTDGVLRRRQPTDTAADPQVKGSEAARVRNVRLGWGLVAVVVLMMILFAWFLGLFPGGQPGG
jgi:cytoskeletal protein RodZ